MCLMLLCCMIENERDPLSLTALLWILTSASSAHSSMCGFPDWSHIKYIYNPWFDFRARPTCGPLCCLYAAIKEKFKTFDLGLSSVISTKCIPHYYHITACSFTHLHLTFYAMYYNFPFFEYRTACRGQLYNKCLNCRILHAFMHVSAMQASASL